MTTSLSKLPDYTSTDTWNALIEESRALIIETKFSAQMTIVEGKHKLGELVATNDLYKRYGKGNQDFVGEVANAIGIGKTELYYCVRFYLKFPKFAQVCNQFPGEKMLTWHKVKILLPSGEECNHLKKEKERLVITRTRCVSCGKILEEVKEGR
jgi:hypothetical protein